jgi:hypothetical protein
MQVGHRTNGESCPSDVVDLLLEGHLADN